MQIPLRSNFQRQAGDVAAVVVLVLCAWLTGGFLLRDDVFIFGDHPGHYWLTWFTLTEALPNQQLAAWMPHWYAGYPELQYYPPGFTLVVWLVRALFLGQLSIAFAYQATVFLAFALPAFTFYYALRHLNFRIPTALAGGLFGLIFSATFDGSLAALIGMIGSRLAFALGPLLIVWLMDVAHGRGKRYWFLSVATLAAAILLHPYHQIGILVAVGLYLLFARLNIVRAGLAVASAVFVAVLLDAFWLAPLLAHASSEMVPLLRSTLDQTWRHMITPELVPFALLAPAALLVVKRPVVQDQRAFVLALYALVIVLGASMLAIHLLLIDRIQFFEIDPVRLIGEYYLAILFLAAIGLGAAVERVAEWLGRNSPVRTAMELGLVSVGCLWLAQDFLQNYAYFTRVVDDEPRFLAAARQEYKLDEFWQVLSESKGRVWFTSYYQQLTRHNREPFATTLSALTPLFTGREILGGTYSGWSPIAALIWVGETNPSALRGLAEDTDDRSLFGKPIETITVEQIDEWARRFNVTTIVASHDDYQTRSLLDTSPHLHSYYNNGLFYAYRMRNYESTWVQATRANIDQIGYEGDRISFHVRLANADGLAHVQVYAAPLWQARTQDGTVLPIRRDEMGLIEIPLAPGSDYTVTLTYEPGTVERAGAIISTITLITLLAGAVFLYYRRVRFASAARPPAHGTLSPD